MDTKVKQLMQEVINLEKKYGKKHPETQAAAQQLKVSLKHWQHIRMYSDISCSSSVQYYGLALKRML